MRDRFNELFAGAAYCLWVVAMFAAMGDEGGRAALQWVGLVVAVWIPLHFHDKAKQREKAEAAAKRAQLRPWERR